MPIYGVRSFDDIVQTLMSEILSTEPTANTTIGSFVRDVLIDIPAAIFADLYGETRIAQEAQSVRDAIESHLDRLLANWALYRRPGTKATGSVWFSRDSAPTSDIEIPAGTRIATSTTVEQDAIEFITTQTVTMLVADASSYYNSDTEVWEIEASVEAAFSGIAGNVGPNIITAYSGDADIGNVANKTATSGGSDSETDAEMRARGLSILKGINIGTKDGYKTLVESIEGVEAAIVVDPNDSEMERVKYGGGADVWISTEESLEATDTYTYESGEAYRILENRPVLSISAVRQDGVILTPGTDTGDDYYFSADTGVYDRSIYANDRVIWNTTPTVGSTIEITYVYCDLIETLQTLLDASDNHHVGAEVLAKASYSADVDVSMTVEVFSGYNPTDVTATVNTVIAAYIDSLLLGENVQQSDIIALAEATPGVDSVVLPLTTFTVTREESGVVDEADYIEGVLQTPATGNLLIRRFETPRADDVTITYYT